MVAFAKAKRLIFYAYDLDAEPGIHRRGVREVCSALQLRGLKASLLLSQSAADQVLVGLSDKKEKWGVGRDLLAIARKEQEIVDSADSWAILL